MAVYQSKTPTKDGKSFFFKAKYSTKNSEEPLTKISKKFLTREEALAAEQEFIIKMAEYKDVPVDMTFQELYDKFIENRKQVCKFTTINTYPNMYKYIKDFMKLKCIDYNIDHYDTWKTKMYKNKKISLRYKNDILKHWKSILNFGTKWYDFNFLSVYRKMEKFRDPNAIKKEMSFYTYEEFKKFISGEDDLRYICYFKTLYFCGLRCGESRGLMWKDIDFDKRLLSVNKQVIYNPIEKKDVISNPKTRTSTRIIPINKILLESLQEYKDYLININSFNNDNFVFGEENGIKPMSEHHILSRKKRNAKLADIKCIRTHDFRHSCASLLINSGANVSMVAKYLGHSEIEETLNTYSHMFPSALDNVLSIINNLNKPQ